MAEPAPRRLSRTGPRDATAPMSNGNAVAAAAAPSQSRVVDASHQPAKRLCNVKVQMNKQDVNTKLGIALENSPPGTCPKVRRVGADGAAAGVLEPDDVIIALDDQPLNVGTAAATDMLRTRVGTLILTVLRAVAQGEEDESESSEEGDDVEEQGDPENDTEDEEEDGEDWLRIKGALAELRAKAIRDSEGAQDTLENAADETVRLAVALKEATVGGHQELMALVGRKTEARCAKEKALAVEAATAAVAKATEVRLKEKHEREVQEALKTAAQQARIDQDAAVEAAIRKTEDRCAEQQRLAVLYATSLTQSKLGVSPEAVAAAAATMAFQEAADSAGAALAAALRLQKEQASPRAGEAEEEPADNNVYFF
mmetsp:Transcript_5600/g.18690  ORF Transcript_5600/g.18690 Transcript_5600/m.18690 type:complete len:370 (+) Transcript_5600:64-1173(+)